MCVAYVISAKLFSIDINVSSSMCRILLRNIVHAAGTMLRSNKPRIVPWLYDSLPADNRVAKALPVTGWRGWRGSRLARVAAHI